MTEFSEAFETLTGHQPFPWQEALYGRFVAGEFPETCSLPTGLGKTSIIAVWLLALAERPDLVPRRLVYVVDRRAVVDQATKEAEDLRERLDKLPDVKSRLSLEKEGSLPISTLRGQYVDNREWLADPVSPVIIVGTVDMIGSRLLFEGYGVTRRMRPFHAGMLGADTLIVLDEAHLVPPFELMLRTLVSEEEFRGERASSTLVPPIKLISLSATARTDNNDAFNLKSEDLENEIVRQRLDAKKRLFFCEPDGSQPLEQRLADQAWELADAGPSTVRIIVYCNSREVAEKTLQAVEKKARGNKKGGVESVAIETELFVGARRVRERQNAAQWLDEHGFLAGSENEPDRPTFLFATSAGEVGVDLDADHMVCDLVAWERMVQRLGRVNRRGGEDREASIVVVADTPVADKKTQEALDLPRSERTKAEQKKVDALHAQRERVEKYRRPLIALPKLGNGYDASPGAIRLLTLKAADDEQIANAIAAATSPAPLRPKLTRPVVDAWSMTSLKEHTGRPIVAPWLRGWIDDEPQTTVLWRRHLPVCDTNATNETTRNRAAKAFFEQAPPHLSEALDTETSRTLDWLSKRARELLKATKALHKDQQNDSEDQLLQANSIVGIVLGRALDVVSLLRLDQLDATGKAKDALRRNLEDNTLVLDLRFGGLTETGLLDPKTKFEHDVAGDDEHWEASGIRVRKSEESAASTDPNWRTCFRFASRISADGDPLEWLLVEKQSLMPTSEEARSVARTCQGLGEHQQWAEREAGRLAKSLHLPDDFATMLRLVARLHDEGKRIRRWQDAFSAPEEDRPYAKTEGPVKWRLLDGYRHEFGSLPVVSADPEFQSLAADLQELALHLVAAHHGYARPVIRLNGCEDGPPSVLNERARDVALRFTRLQRTWGPWGLAWWESLLRAADQRASRKLDLADPIKHEETTDG